MTLVIALTWQAVESEAVLVSCDARVTNNPIAYELRKVNPIYSIRDEEIDLAMADADGESAIMRYRYALARYVL